jgi:hypothetical protein
MIKCKKLKAIVMVLLLCVCGGLYAQRSDGFFNYSQHDERENDSPFGTNPTTSNYGPVGSGLLVLAAMGTCYAIINIRKKGEKK